MRKIRNDPLKLQMELAKIRWDSMGNLSLDKCVQYWNQAWKKALDAVAPMKIITRRKAHKIKLSEETKKLLLKRDALKQIILKEKDKQRYANI